MTNAAKSTETLIRLATDSRNALLSKVELDDVWTSANYSLQYGKLGAAFAATEALLCQADRGNVCPDVLPQPSTTKLVEMHSSATLQSLVDRVEAVNRHVENR